jgi:hypothetical protein
MDMPDLEAGATQVHVGVAEVSGTRRHAECLGFATDRIAGRPATLVRAARAVHAPGMRGRLSANARARLTAAFGLAGVLLLGVAGCTSAGVNAPSVTDQRGSANSIAPDTAAPGVGTGAPAINALALLATLPVKGKAPKTGYDRTGMFGPAWLDVDHNGCDTRNDVLARDLTRVTKSGPCKVLTGTLVDPYTGKTINFVRGNDTSAFIQIDHRVALENAWVTGAQQLSQTQREALANDPLNLVAVGSQVNSAKGDGDAATWLPPLKSYRCAYVTSQILVKAKYSLWVASAEHDAMVRVLRNCPGQSATPVTSTPTSAPQPPPVPAPAPAPKTATPGGYCSTPGATGVAANGKTYTCGKKGPDSHGKFHWNK